ncbi:MAG: hypothetical protein JSV60_04150 [Desulfobacterales bacterium]|nr:MAG: hypothetical protein JSV60_04150 [Desulfobacterales bacterium]
MRNELDKVLTKIGEEYGEDITNDSRFYVEVDIGKKAEELGYSHLKEVYHDVNAMVPLKKPAKGMTVRIDGRTFVNYAQLESGIAIPGYVAKEVGLPHETYEPNDSMILSFT